jgi:hypothetical protein
MSANMNTAIPTWSLVTAYPFRQPERVYFNPFNQTEMWVSSFGNGMRVGNTGIYYFIGNGDWNTTTNWRNGLVPPATVAPGMTVYIQPVNGGTCAYNGSIVVQPGGILVVKPGNLQVSGNIVIQ